MSRRRIAPALLFVAVVATAAGVYAFLAPNRYEATARVVVHPVSASNATFTGIDVLRATGETPRDLETAAHFFDTPDVLSTTATRLSLTQAEVADALDVHPLAGSNVLVIVARGSTPELAAQIANGVVQEAISQRTARVQAQVSAVLEKLRKSPSPEAQRRVVDLQALQSRPDPTLETLSAATAPTQRASPKRTAIIVGATGAALVLAATFLLLTALLMSRRNVVALADASARDGDEARALTRRAAAIDQRERELEQVVTDAKDAIAEQARQATEQARQATERERGLAERAAERERATARHITELAERESRAAERAAALELELAAAPPVPDPEPEPELPAVSEPVRSAGWTIPQLEQLLERRGAEFPDRVEEWSYYVVFLGEHADAQGALPASFDYLIDETFAELL